MKQAKLRFMWFWCFQGVCSLLKQALSTLKDDSAPMVSDLVTMAVNMYQMFPHPTILELGKQVWFSSHSNIKFFR